jgi:hypothetical protein
MVLGRPPPPKRAPAPSVIAQPRQKGRDETLRLAADAVGRSCSAGVPPAALMPRLAVPRSPDMGVSERQGGICELAAARYNGLKRISRSGQVKAP